MPFFPVSQPTFSLPTSKGTKIKKKTYDDLTIAEKPNVDTETIATSCASKPINIHIQSAPFAIFVRGSISIFLHTKEYEK